MRELEQREKDELEGLIDRTGLYSVLGGLAEICHEKADHLRTNWQDPTSAKEWEKAGKRITAASDWIGKNTHL